MSFRFSKKYRNLMLHIFYFCANNLISLFKRYLHSQVRHSSMKFHIITIFPESFESYFDSSMMKRARDKKLFSLEFYKLGDFSDKNFQHVDDKAYGMHWQVLSPEPLSRAIEHVFTIIWNKVPVYYMSPRGKILTQEATEKHAQVQECIIICGHYEWIDQRIIDIYVDREISIGEYILTSGEIAASVFIDSVVRHIPWVLGNPESLQEESFSQKLGRQKEYPLYTRPREFMWKKVPDILTSGNHQAIEKWKHDHLS